MIKSILNFFKKYLIILIVLLGVGLRLINIGVEPLWGDEILSASIVKHYQGDLAGMATYLSEVEVHPPLYYFLLDFWIKIFGFNEEIIRYLSVVFGMGVVLLAYHFAKILFGRRVGLLTAFLVAILPMQIEFSHQARPYIIFCFFGLLSVYSLWQFLKLKNNNYLFLYVVSSVIGLYLHYSFVFILFSILSWWLFVLVKNKNYGRDFVFFLVAIFFIFLGFYPWLDVLLFKLSLSKLDLLATRDSLNPYRISHLFDSGTSQFIWFIKEKMLHQVEIFAIVLFKISFLVFLLQLIRRASNLEEDKEKIFYLGWIFAVSFMIYLFSISSCSYTRDPEKHLILSSVIAAILFAWVISRLEFKKRILLLVFLLASLSGLIFRVVSDDSLWALEYRFKVFAEFINKNYKTGDLVLSDYNFARPDLNFYLEDKIPSDGFYPTKLQWDDYLASRETLGLIENESQHRLLSPDPIETDSKMQYLMDKYDPTRIWLVSFSDDLVVNKWLDENGWRHAIAAEKKLFPVDLYVKK